MFELQGKYGTAKVFTDVVEQSAIAQVISLLNQPYVEGSQVRMMPDIHVGVGCTIGATMTIKDRACPNLVGVDIGCGMETARLREDHIDLQKLDQVIRAKIPSGFDIQEKAHPFDRKIDLSKLCCANKLNLDHAYNCLGTLGGGNHFIEANRDDDGNIYIVIHSGSRHLGKKVAMYYQKAGYKALTTYSREEIQAVVDEMKAAGKAKDIQRRLQAMGSKPCPIPEDFAYVEGELFEQYLHDLEIVQEFAALNRQAMMNNIVTAMGLHVEEQFSTIHNYIDTKNMILRKGAVSAQAGEKLLIPINMRDGSLLCTGKGNPDWNYSAPHGAGRLMSRSAAKEAFTVDEFRAQMAGIYTTSVGRSTLDECPMAYKGMADIVDNIGPAVTIDAVIKPIYNFKAGEEI